jgi:hypothetical protein
METPKAAPSSSSLFGNLLMAIPALAGVVKDFASDFFKQTQHTPPVSGIPTVDSPSLFSWAWTVEKGMQGLGLASNAWNQLPGSVQGMIVSVILYRLWSWYRNEKRGESFGGNHVTVYNNPALDYARLAQEVVKELFHQLPHFIESQKKAVHTT